MQYKISGDEMRIVLEKGDLQTDPPPSLSPTCASAMLVGLAEVKKLLVELVPMVEKLKDHIQNTLPRLRKLIRELP